MLQIFLIIAFTLTCTASPFHKYPFVFLLDVGNEELGTNNAEQIKVSVPGGSLAIKYPATGDGDIIGHIRVTGIDYGTDLKANIVEGGPGYRYVVLVFTGNLGVQYDTVVTIQTMSDDNLYKKEADSKGISIETGSYEVKEQEDDLNNSAEETDDEPEMKLVYSEKMNAELMQSSSNMYRYEKNENFQVNEQDDSSDEGDDENEEYNKSDDIDDQISNSLSNSNSEAIDDSDDSLSNYEQKDNAEVNSPEEDDGDDDGVIDLQKDDTGIPIKLISVYGKFNAFKSPYYGDVMLYPQVALPQDRVFVDHSENDDGQLNNEEQSKDSNNNANDYVSSVEY
ncbi:protein PFC0760c-like [Zerene cesonia]|uniref:protein PFC0760c-like n=1 Tax=Zerene cesonia TaxID=33412 RepID=UPI0018E53734|nr:protein PFC0760c-like [Zerene cesonia]